MKTTIDLALCEKYNLPVPRYTSYPTVPFWKEGISKAEWGNVFREQFMIKNGREGVSIYLHLPFCESLCTYCGCNKKITTNHGVEEEYLLALQQEWQQYLALMGERPVIRELHLGGGTPTFFSPSNLVRLLEGIFSSATIHEEHEFSVEGHPNNTTREHLKALYDLGFRRISYGVQDHDPEVQRIINRIQPLEQVQRATAMAREIGFHSVNFDLIYGLPRQTRSSLERTIEQTIEMHPDRIAFYSYAHVPWTSRGQRLFDEQDLPTPAEKMELYLLGIERFTGAGYVDIGMDHFALPQDDLCRAREEGRLHRNFMGYTTQRTGMLIGLGVSSISDAGIAYAQNEKTLHDYYETIRRGDLAVFRGHFLSGEDVSFKKYILDISCKGFTRFHADDMDFIRQYGMPVLDGLREDGLVEVEQDRLSVTPLGRHFIRNICSAFDLHLQRTSHHGQAQPKFSKAI